MIRILFAALLGLSMFFPFSTSAQDAASACKKNVLFNLNGIAYSAPRTKTISYYRMDGSYVKSTDPQSPVADCSISDLGQVAGFTTGFVNTRDYDFQLRLKGGDGVPAPPATTYQEVKSYIDDAIKNETYERLKDGTRVFTYGETSIYLLPRNIAPTESADNEPAAVVCKVDRITAKLRGEQDKRSSMSSKNRELYGQPIAEKDKVQVPHVCQARYLYNGISFGYLYYEFKPGDHLALDFYVRRRLENLKVKDQAPQAESQTAPEAAKPPAAP